MAKRSKTAAERYIEQAVLRRFNINLSRSPRDGGIIFHKRTGLAFRLLGTKQQLSSIEVIYTSHETGEDYQMDATAFADGWELRNWPSEIESMIANEEEI